MRILHVQPYFQPKIGYQETYLTRKQARAGHDVLMVAADRFFPYPNYKQSMEPVLGERIVGAGRTTEGGVAVHRLQPVVELASAGVIVLRGLVRACLDFQPEVVHCHGTFSFMARQIALAKPKLKAPILFDNHASDFNTSFTRTFSRRVYRRLMRRFIAPPVLRAADELVAIGEGERTLLACEYGIPEERIELLYLGADTDVFRFDEEARERTRRNLGVATDDVLLVHAGKLEPQKDVENLLAAAVPLLARNLRLKMLIVGGGEAAYLAKLETAIAQSPHAGRIIRLGLAPTEKLRDYYSAADLGAWPGNFSNTIVEAMACGLPIVVPEVISAFSTNCHLLVDGAALGYERGNVESLRDRLSALIDDASFRQSTGDKARAHIEKNLSWDVINDQFVSLYSAMISRFAG